MSLAKKEIFEFGEFRLDVNEHTIERIDGVQNGSLTEKAFRALVLLVRRHGHLVTKAELIGFIWPDTIVEDNNLEKCIHHLRQFLGETPAKTAYIETVRKHGYRFVGNVRAIEVSGSWIPETFRFPDQHPELEPAPARTFESVAAGGEPRRYPFRRIFAVSAVLLLWVSGVAALGFYFLVRSDSVGDGKKSIAVLPLRPIDRANRSAFHEVGVADALIQRLSSTKGLVVRPLNFTREYTEIDQDPFVAGREQKVDYVVASNYQIANGRIRVTSRLLDVATGRVDDTITVEKDSADLFPEQDAMANEISSKLLARFGSGAGEVYSRRGTENKEAYTYYLWAMNLSEERGLPNVLKSLEYLDRAVALDPNYALAWAAKARTHGDVVAHTDLGQHENYRSSMDAIGRALAIDPNLSEAYSALCYNRHRYEYDAEGAEGACRRAVELDPNSPVAHKTYANFLYTRGRFDEAIAEIRTAMELQPVSFRNQQMYALTLYFARRYDEAEAQFRRLIELSPKHSFIHRRLIKVLEEQGRESDAYEFLIKMLTIEKDDKTAERFRRVYRKSGWRGVKVEQIRIAEANASSGNFQLACLYAKVGDKDNAFRQLETAFRQRSFQIAILQVEPQLDPLRNDPRFADLVRRVEGK